MNPTELAKIYMKSFFGEKPLEDLSSILSEDLKFAGPFYTFNTGEEYIESLRESMPADAISYEILQEVEKGNSCCLVYQSKRHGVCGVDEIMAQLFEVSNNQIIRIRLILDAAKLLKNNNPDYKPN
ncbi:hypothetical protein [uncultured Cocleimonas sp.]|uniref:hypothetical protein n=1 Tax=uncultured Cocleimonas sp. TaxID=1051587 RepID=UPI002604F1AE|nr:hypothetical protein [uncultured Cocleimonas sp.]